LKYKPMTSNKGKWLTVLTSKHGGLHNQKKFKEAVAMIEYASEHFRRPNLCHICFTHANHSTYQAVVKRFCRSLANLGIRYCYKAALENDNVKGEHLHLMLIVEHKRKRLHGLINNQPSSLLGSAVGFFQDSSLIRYRVCQSRYSGDTFLHITKTMYEPFNEAIEWLSYIYKVRSKQNGGMTYFSSRAKQSNLSANNVMLN
jgi:hypothetical protein